MALPPSMLGKGAFGKVYSDGNEAVKKFEEMESMLQELIIMRYFVDSPYIIKCKSFDMSRMEMRLDLYDMSLKDAVQKHEFSLQEKHIIFRDILRGVSHLHTRYIHHCDIKYSNILVNISPLRAVVADLGLASMGKYARYLQTPKGCRRPNEELDPRLEHRHDLYSLALLGLRLFGDIDLETIVTPARLREIIMEVSDDIPEDIRDALIDFTRDKGELYPTCRIAYQALYKDDAVLAIPPTNHPSPLRISDENRLYIYDTFKTRTKGVMKTGKRGYQVLMERINNPAYSKIPQTEYPLYIACMILIISVMFENGDVTLDQVLEMVSGRWSRLDVARVLTDIITKDQLIYQLLAPE
jgi:serine/threonine protein kinase